MTNTPPTQDAITEKQVIAKKCIRILGEKPAGVSYQGTIPLDPSTSNYESTYLWNLNTGRKFALVNEGEAANFSSVSPNREWAVYSKGVMDPRGWISPQIRNLVVIDTWGTRYAEVQVRPDELGSAIWVNNQTLLTLVVGEEPDLDQDYAPSPMLLIYPFNGGKQLLQMDFPGFQEAGPVPGSSSFGYVVYDPTLTRVVHIQAIRDFAYALHDLESHQEITRLPTGDLTWTPVWSADGSRFAVATGSWDYGKPLHDLFSVSRTGEVTALTHFVDNGISVAIGAYQWSPDGTQLAFWFHRVDSEDLAHLGIVDLATLDVTDYCMNQPEVQMTDYYAQANLPAPIWSPDGKQLLISSTDGVDSQVALVDLERRFAFPVAIEGLPSGWMKEADD